MSVNERFVAVPYPTDGLMQFRVVCSISNQDVLMPIMLLLAGMVVGGFYCLLLQCLFWWSVVACDKSDIDL